ncbi:OPT superfamily oligopeptide transporter [Ophiocordyceps camponoti-floridani]|uniref:OPT superfamily oligopeptide transporter n=1 Tax=Ophiocordyceps camponoti-floridani TaxID=2030778 RepID=A0A8H4Q949_9HYPO|nr:OPT superfamily oligopeptide transporter [Ophiocordyceps camponoti-floridani]
MGIMPLGCGFVGVIPAMNYLLTSDERGPLSLRLDQLIVWSLGLCYFGVVFAVPLRHQVIVRERLSIMGVRALGETDLNPVSGISKLAQLLFALIIPQSDKSSVLINLVAGAVSEAGALQAGDLMQDLKTGHLLGASPRAQFYGQMIGATFGAILSAVLYGLYTKVYAIPGHGLPPMASQWATGAGALFTLTTMFRIATVGKAWRSWVPGGIAVAVGIYNVPSFTFGRAIGGLLSWYWTRRLQRSGTPLIIVASGFVLGEGFLSIVTLILQSFGVPHF